ncbi:SDR family NAD(P)-dependent oxidoreductase [Nocardioides gilvus]|uniref:SDR family NAD(P)-dependent oxidoreductase n=1 Tax=Nocardioides gilvus TaxID=1735589 RepID=UPI000D743BBE|nr:SDR family NAD(P)-dependent oxidoreductase [Nocardioides gilvus]
MKPSAWRPESITDQTGRTFLVTGTSPGGIGFHVALSLAAAGGRVVLAGRTPERITAAVAQIRAAAPEADLEELVVDLAAQDSVRRAAREAEVFGPLHALVNNAGVRATRLQRTVDGLELQMATNHFGPFLLTGLLLPQLVASGDGRVVTVASRAHHRARRAPLEDPRTPPFPYRKLATYDRSKLANLLFTFELDRRLWAAQSAAQSPVRALAAHPGYAATPLFANGAYGRPSGGPASILDAVHKAVAQPAAHGAWPVLMATLDDLPGATYCGPTGRGELRGPPGVVQASNLAHDAAAQRELWEISERTVGLRYP